MAPAPPPDPRPEDLVELVEPAMTRTWAALWLYLGLALFVSAGLLASAEVFLALKTPLLGAILGEAKE
ncbi:MAG: hypothetical protein U1E65_00610 [Myxococcota bacterium]